MSCLAKLVHCFSRVSAALSLALLLTLPQWASAQATPGLEYRIGPEDVLHISVWKEEDLDRKVVVRPDGGVCEVAEPGQFTLGRYVDVVQALTLAGGFTPYANNRSIKVLRRQDGREVSFEFDFRDVSRGRDLQQNIVLQSGDVVLVP